MSFRTAPFFVLLALGGMLPACTHPTAKSSFKGLRQLRLEGWTQLYPEKSVKEMFKCADEATLARLHGAQVSVQRIGASNFQAIPAFSVDEQDNGALLGRLLDYECYGEASMCDFLPALRIKLSTHAEQRELLVCFQCGDILFVSPPNASKQRRSRMFGMSPELKKDLLALAKAAYPDDLDLRPLYRKSRPLPRIRVHRQQPSAF